MAKKLMLIDGNAVGYQSHNTTPLYAGDMQTQAIFHFIKTIRKLLQLHPEYRIFVLWDKLAKWRYDLHPQYKGDRSNDPEKIARREAYKKQRPMIQKALNALGIDQISAEDCEADDLAGYFVAQAQKTNTEVMLVTGDEDWLQLVSPTCSWFDPIRDKFVNHNNFPEYTGYATPEMFLDGKALIGDNSDTIPGVGGIGEKGAPDFINQYGGVRAFLKLADEGRLPKKLPAAEKRLAENTAPNPSKKYGAMLPARDAYERNMKLMDLRNKEKPTGAIHSVRGKYNRFRFEDICAELAFHSILKIIDSWVEPFEWRKAA